MQGRVHFQDGNTKRVDILKIGDIFMNTQRTSYSWAVSSQLIAHIPNICADCAPK